MKKFEMYTRDGCGYCRMAKELIQLAGIPAVEYKLSKDITKELIQQRVAATGSNAKVTTVPQIFYIQDGKERYIGGFEELNKIIHSLV